MGYQVFLSFRGSDTRKTFTDHLYTALIQSGIRTFRDDNAILRGDNIDIQIRNSIRDSTISIIVFSKHYASSPWCLNELLMIMERRKANNLVVIPVFYDVVPEQVWEQSGSFAEAFEGHENRFEIETVDTWRQALREVAELGGMVLQDRYESQFIQDIIKKVKDRLKHMPLYVCSHPVGLKSRVRQINLWLQDDSIYAGSLAAIFGIGGVGKTTIAKTVYNNNVDKFEGSSFLANVRETSEQHNGLIRLQQKLLSDILKGKTSKIQSVDEGIVRIRDAILCRRVFIVIDDVDDLRQLNALFGLLDWLCEGSKVLVTTRQENLFTANKSCVKFEIKPLDNDESLQLFCWHAFGHASPHKDYLEYSKHLAHYCCGVPLALEVLGSSLSGKTEDLWKISVTEPESIDGYSKIQKILRISYDSLEDDRDKTLFLDIACFFEGKDKYCVDRIAERCDFYRKAGIQTLIDRSLLKIDVYNKLLMHRLVRDMGREIVRQESPEDPGKRSRLWRHKDAFTILRKNTGTKSIKSFILDCQHLEEASTSLREFRSNIFAKMTNLRLLQLNSLKLERPYKNFPASLVWLCWRGFPLNCVPSSFCLEDLIVLDLHNSNLRYGWKGIWFLPELKILDLSHSHNLVSTSDLSGLANLQKLILKDCISLVEVHESIGKLNKLVVLNLKNCKSLRKLPEEIGALKSLEELILSGCSNLRRPSELGKFSLGLLDIFGISSTIFYSAKKFLSGEIIKSTSFSFPMLPSSLVDLSLRGCNISDDALPKNLSTLSHLKYLDLSGNPFHHLPESIGSLNMLQFLGLYGCKRLLSLPKLPQNLLKLSIGDCTSLQSIIDLPNLFQSWNPNTLHTDKIVAVQYLVSLGHTRNIAFKIISKMDDSSRSKENIEFAAFNVVTNAVSMNSLQVLLECGTFDLSLACGNVPSWCFHQLGRFGLPDLEGLTRSSLSLFNNDRPKAVCSDRAAVTLQRIYRSYRTRRLLADCAVVTEELWRYALEVQKLGFNLGTPPGLGVPEFTSPLWSTVRKLTAEVANDYSSTNSKDQDLSLLSWLEAIDPRHRNGPNLHLYYNTWFKHKSIQPFFYWLDIGDGKEVNIERCPRLTLQKECIKYLPPIEREAYEVCLKDGKFFYIRSGELLHTPEESEWIFVLSTRKRLYVGKHEKGTFHHSSFLAGGATLSAGSLVVERGVLKEVLPYSKYYLQTEATIKQLISLLLDNGVDVANVKFHYLSSSSRKKKKAFTRKGYGSGILNNQSDGNFFGGIRMVNVQNMARECTDPRQKAFLRQPSKLYQEFSSRLVKLEVATQGDVLDIFKQDFKLDVDTQYPKFLLEEGCVFEKDFFLTHADSTDEDEEKSRAEVNMEALTIKRILSSIQERNQSKQDLVHYRVATNVESLVRDNADFRQQCSNAAENADKHSLSPRLSSTINRFGTLTRCDMINAFELAKPSYHAEPSSLVEDGYEYAEDPFLTEEELIINKTTMDKSAESLFQRMLSSKWATGAGARIVCVRDYPTVLQSHALECTRLVRSPRTNIVLRRSNL